MFWKRALKSFKKSAPPEQLEQEEPQKENHSFLKISVLPEENGYFQYCFTMSNLIYQALLRSVEYNYFSVFCKTHEYGLVTQASYAYSKPVFLPAMIIYVSCFDLSEFENSKEFRDLLKRLKKLYKQSCIVGTQENQVELANGHCKQIERFLFDDKPEKSETP